MNSSNSKAREYLENLNGMHILDRPEYARTIPDMSAFEDKLLESGCPHSEVEELIQELEYYRGMGGPSEGVILMKILDDSIQTPTENSSIVETTEISETAKPRFRTSVPAINNQTRGGGYGVTTIGGNAKAGKTMFAVGTAIEAAKMGWRVIFINAELDKSEIVMAVMRYCDQLIPKVVKENLTIVMPDLTFAPRDAIVRVRQAVSPTDNRILIVLDSINALVDLSSESGAMDYWAANSIWRNWAVRATRKSEGRLAFLIVSETNKEGAIKGRALEYKSDLVIQIIKDRDNDDQVSIDVTRSRSTRSGSLGNYFRDWMRGRFMICS